MKNFRVILVTAIILLAAGAAQAQDIFDAVKNENTPKVKALIDKDASQLNIKDEAGNTPLHHAVIIGSTSIIEFLLSKGADIDAQNTRLNTPIHDAIQNKKENISALLIERGADLSKTNINEQTPLHKAASLNQKGTGKLLIAKGAAIDPVDRYGRTPFLLVARQTGDVKFGKLLLDKGADINIKDKDNQMALNLAAWRGFTDFTDFLLDNGAEYDTTQGGARWMLIHSVRYGSIRLFKVVLERENGLLSDDSIKRNIMHTAITGGSVEIINLLLSKNFLLNNNANSYGWTPSHYAAQNGHAGMIRFLAEKKFNIDQRTLSGKSAYNIAEENNQDEVLQTIKELKGDTGQARFPTLTGTFMGQAPPTEVKLFAPDIISSPHEDDNHGSIAFMPDGKEIYWNLRGKIWMTRLQNDKWIEPEIASFCEDGEPMFDNPFITSDGKKLFFTSTRSGSVSEKKENIWFVERTSSGWSEPKPVSPEVNAVQIHWGISVSDSGTLYFGGTGQENFGMSDVYYSKLVDGVYSKPVNMGAEINSKDSDHCPFIAPDESYIIFSRFSNSDRGFYISFKDKSEKWSKPVKIHERLMGVCPLISHDGKYFFFNSDGIYWMPAYFIEELRSNSIR
ncbi:ankyrin repeat domain-containing protein [Acidobacteriota bacterium]